jgi:hypothetical protein
MIALLIVCLLPAALLFAAIPAVLFGLVHESLSRMATPDSRVATAVSEAVGWDEPPSSSRLILQTAA